MTAARTRRGSRLGVRRLSIVDVVGGHQPVSSEDGTVVAVQNGELYNHDEIREDSARTAIVFTSRCDTEILPHLYERDGHRFPVARFGEVRHRRLGRHRRRAVLARDRLGVKPSTGPAPATSSSSRRS